jgi:hypothetical protein
MSVLTRDGVELGPFWEGAFPGVVSEPDPQTPAPDEPPPEASRHPGARQGAIAFGLYLLAAFLLYGLPVLRHYASTFAGKGAGDSTIFLWSFAWWPHALANGQSPVLTHAVFAPTGLNLAWSTSIPGPAILMWPITRAFGPLVSMNLVTMFAPALAAWGAYLVCRRITVKFWPALLGGSLFGFSSYMTQQLSGHVNLFLIFPIPLAVYLVIRRVDGSLPLGRFVVGLGLVLVLQFSISTEVFATLAFFGGLTMIGALVFAKDARVRVASTAGWTVLAYALATLILFPLLAFVWKGAPAAPFRPVIVGSSSVDLQSFLFPRRSTLIGHETFRHYVGPALGPPEQGAYVPLPILLMLLLAAWTLFRDRITRLIFAFTLIAVVFSLGTYLHANGQTSIPLPWTPFAHLPILRDALPSRFTAYVWLGIALIAACWMDRAKRPLLRAGVVGLGAIMLLPNISSADVHTPLQVPAFFTAGDYRRYIPQGQTILYIHSDKGDEMLAQVESQFWFSLAQGHMGPAPAVFREDPGFGAIDSADVSGLDYRILRGYIREHHIGTVVIGDDLAARWDPVVGRATGVGAATVGGVQVYSLPSPVVSPGSGGFPVVSPAR